MKIISVIDFVLRIQTQFYHPKEKNLKVDKLERRQRQSYEHLARNLQCILVTIILVAEKYHVD